MSQVIYKLTTVRSYCAEHKPIIKPKRKYNYPKGRRPYDDAE